jgi:hypothetical protein
VEAGDMAEKITKTQNDAPKRQIVRGSKWPLLNISDAINKARVIYKFEKKTPTTADVMLSHLGFNTRTGPANRTLAALRQYGLVEKKGNLFCISDKAWRIFVLPEDSPERQAIVRELALKPALFKELVALYPDGLPSDATLKSYLILSKGFNENTVQRLIKTFKADIDIAKPYEKGYTFAESDKEEDDDFDEDEEVSATVNNEQETRNRRTSSISTDADYSYSYQLSFPRNIRAEVRIFGQDLRKHDIKRLSDEVADLAKAFDDSEDIKRPAIWHNKEFDIPVMVLGMPETGPDDRAYVSIEGSKSKIPFDEIEYTD